MQTTPAPGETEIEGLYLFNGQRPISMTLVVMVFISMPMFLCVKPCIACCCGPKEEDHHENQSNEVRASEAENAAEQDLIQREDSSQPLIQNSNAYKIDMAGWEKILNSEYGP